MDEQAIARILASYKLISPRMDEMVAGFYDRVFKLAPEARALFKQDMTLQRQHLAATFALLVRNFQFYDVLEEAVMDLGAHHLKLGIRPEQYPIVRQAFLAAIAETLGAGCTPQLTADWTELLDQIISVMLKGATVFAVKETAKTKPTPLKRA